MPSVWPFVNKETFLYNTIGIALGVLALHEFYTRPPGVATRRAEPKKAANLHRTATSNPAHPQRNQHWPTASFPLGALLFILHNHLTDASTLIAWSWTGYENRAPRGPIPHLHGAITLAVQCAGLLLPVVLTSLSASASESTWWSSDMDMKILTHPMWLAFGSASTWVMYTYKDWTGYTGGLGLAFWAMSITPMVFQRAAAFAAEEEKVARTYATAFLVYCLLVLTSIFTVAYAFVPGGVYLRERTDWLVSGLVCLLCVLIGISCLAVYYSHKLHASHWHSAGQTKTKTFKAVHPVTHRSVGQILHQHRSPRPS